MLSFRAFLSAGMQPMTRLLEPRLAPCITVSQKRTKRRIPPYKEENIAEKEMKRIAGVSDCPSNCLCSQNIEITFKNIRLLTQFTSQQTGRILPRTITKVCLRKQKRIAREIKRARTMALMPYTESLLKYHGDPRLFNKSRAQTEMYLQINKDRELTRMQKFQS